MSSDLLSVYISTTNEEEGKKSQSRDFLGQEAAYTFQNMRLQLGRLNTLVSTPTFLDTSETNNPLSQDWPLYNYRDFYLMTTWLRLGS